MPVPGGNPEFSTHVQVGWEAALLELEHQAEHWNTPDHGQVGYLLAQALRAAVDIARTGGLRCEHRNGSAGVHPAVLQVIECTPVLARRKDSDAQLPAPVGLSGSGD
jgi:hypothetical protein